MNCGCGAIGYEDTADEPSGPWRIGLAMPPSELRTTHLRHLLPRIQHNDADAVEELLRRAGQRLERLARQMLRGYPVVRGHEQTADVVQEAVPGLLAALRQLDLRDTRAFYGLAAEHIRRRLLDLARRHGRGNGPVRSLAAVDSVADPAGEDDLERWAALHESVELLPAEMREVFGLRFYHGWAWAEVAELFGLSEPAVRRRWLAALVRLGDRLGDRVP
jgi:RNA polymerase sigma factor (sigma-70 family)